MSAQPTATFSTIAERLLAQARLCEQIARKCSSEETAEKLRRVARDCARAATEIALEEEAKRPTWH